jgi:preprotein translocase subunit SecA
MNVRDQKRVPESPITDGQSAWRGSLGSSTKSRLEGYLSTIASIESLGLNLSNISDGELRTVAADLRRAAVDGTPLDDLVPSWFALVRETADRALGERPYDPQLLTGLALYHGHLAEMNTGEGKTLAAVAPVSLAALAGHGVHVLTFNDYLAQRDAQWMGPVYERLGLTSASISEGMGPAERKSAYRADITYLTVREAGFDLLRDGLCLDPTDQVHRPFHAAIVDEADSILIDEARIPLVIAGTFDDSIADLDRLAELARALEAGNDFTVDETARNVFLTDPGIQRTEEFLGCGNLFAPENSRLQAEVRNAVHARALLKRDVDYIVRDGRIELVDELTGRVAENRHWPEGLQAAIEAKEDLHPQPEGRVLSSITIQHFLQKYPTLSGMTATASSSASELSEVYGLSVVQVPPYRPCIRKDLPDFVFMSKTAKRRALLEEISGEHRRGRPVLVGTISVEESEALANELLERGIACRVLNARNDGQEAAIIAEAGVIGAVTISTNMAGRGTDIRLGGSSELERDKVLELGGLYVIGTNRHESRRIDDQLRGRAARQGDPGSSRFFISLDDELLERCGIRRLIPSRLLPQGGTTEPLAHPAIQREIERAQRIIEGQFGDIRTRLLRYSRLIESQQEDIQKLRQNVLLDRDDSMAIATRAPDLWDRLRRLCGESRLGSIVRRIKLLAIDGLWRDHLDRVDALRDEVLLVQFDGRQPLVEYYRSAGAWYEQLLETMDGTVIETLERIQVTADGVDWEQEGLLGPSSTWTYMVNDSAYGENTFLTLSTRPGLGMWAVLTCWWLLIPWAAAIHWQRWRRRRKASSPADEPRNDRQKGT